MVETPERAFFMGIQKEHFIMNQKSPLFLLGVSFFPMGLYPFLWVKMGTSMFLCFFIK